MPQPIFYFSKISSWDKVTIGLYIILSIFLWHYFGNAANNKIQRDILFGYSIGTQFFLYFFNYKSLRNLSVYFFWVGIGILHLFIYLELKDVEMLQNVRGHSATGLRNTIILLFLFQVLRFVSAKTQGQELVCPSKGSRTDFFDERRVTILDFILFVVYIATTFLLLFKD
ncbi:hypothetical protein [Aquiflexum gelatinilyticum]|uniref:Uncharacterized protein n=1 Tax=Aquiflexum gelatinilyticum TaxID=2961943 RepID=A0A9X2P5P6_9BACT|nr:hypothetical protein [Aquiflexum gelatinilyticum]MCR9016839.1 hypothetical protein [Aquiflexum gelatinilyticum]